MAFTGQIGVAASTPGNVVPGLGSSPNPFWFGFQDTTNELTGRQTGRRRRLRRAAAVLAAGVMDAYVPEPFPAPWAAPFPEDLEEIRGVYVRNLLRRQRRVRDAEALLYQHRFGVDVVDPFIVVRTVRSMLAAGAWEPGGY